MGAGVLLSRAETAARLIEKLVPWPTASGKLISLFLGIRDGLVAGVLVSLFQTVTSIQDNVLAFIPRAMAIFVVFALTFPWMLRVVSGFSASLIQRLPELVR